MKIKTFYMPILGFKFEIFDDSGSILPDKTVKAVTLINPDKYLVQMGFNFSVPWGTPTVAHECLHAIHGIFKARGVHADFENDELECYFLEWLMEQVSAILLKHEPKLRGIKDGQQN